MKLIPFNVEKAKAGRKVVTRDGSEFVFGGYNPNAEEYHQVVGWIGTCVIVCSKDGKQFRNKASSLDLFLVAETKTMWIAICREENCDETRNTSHLCSTEEDLVERGYTETFWIFKQIEIEE